MASTLCCLVALLFLLVLGRAQVPYSYWMHFAKCFGACNVQLSHLGGSFVRCFSVSVLSFSTSPNSGVKICGGFLRSENTIFRIIFAGCPPFLVFLFLSAAIARETGLKRSEHTNTHTAQHPSQEWRSAAETRAEAHTPTPHTPARIGGVQEERAPKRTHTPTPQLEGAGRSPKPNQDTHTRTIHRSQEWRGTSEAHTRAHTHPNTPARGAGRNRNPSPSTHTHTAHPSQEWRATSGARTRTPQHPSQEWQGAAEARAQAHPPTLHTPARSGRAPEERAHEHTHGPTSKKKCFFNALGYTLVVLEML